MTPAIRALLAPYPLIMTLPVQWGEMDAARHVNNIVYLRWAESARIEYFIRLGYADFTGEKVGMILGAIACKYIYPMTFPDKVLLGTRTKEIRKDRFILETAIISEQEERLAALVEAAIVPYDYNLLKKAGMPQDLVEGIQVIEQNHLEGKS